MGTWAPIHCKQETFQFCISDPLTIYIFIFRILHTGLFLPCCVLLHLYRLNLPKGMEDDNKTGVKVTLYTLNNMNLKYHYIN